MPAEGMDLGVGVGDDGTINDNSCSDDSTSNNNCSDVDHNVEVEMTLLRRPRGISTSSTSSTGSASSTSVSRKTEDVVDVERPVKQQTSSVRSTPPVTPPSSCASHHNKRLRRAFGGDDYGAVPTMSSRSRDHDNSASRTKLLRQRRPALCSRHRRRGGSHKPCSCRGWVLGITFCLGIVFGAFNVGFRWYWVSRCLEGCYEAVTTGTGSEGPEQVHLAYSGVDAEGNPTGMTVVWTTAAGEAPPVVHYGLHKDELRWTAQGTSVRYLDTVHHRVSLVDLAPGTRFFYRCGHSSPLNHADASGGYNGSDESVAAGGGQGVDDKSPRETAQSDVGRQGTWSDVSSFVTAPGTERLAGDGPWDRPVSVAVVGDLGLVNAGATFDRLHQLVEDEEVDFVLHLGDIAYADDAFLERLWSFGYEDKWDAFMRRVSRAFGSKVPYMVVPGNHESECHSPACLFSVRKLRALRHFNAYNARFRMPSTESGADHGTAMWYSFNLGPVHFVVVDTETDFPGASGDHFTWARVGRSEGFGDQLAWLEEDLARADQERDVRPWIVVSGHRPIYSNEELRNGKANSLTERIRQAFEPLLEKYKVDVYLGGHVHTFERSFPVFNNRVRFKNDNNEEAINGVHDKELPLVSTNMVYDEPAAPVHIVNGAGGNIEGPTPTARAFPGEFPQWHALSMTMVAGIGILSFPSMAEMRSTFITSESPAEVLDELSIRHPRPPLA